MACSATPVSTPVEEEGVGRGVWTAGEHERFIEAMALYPCGPWKLITDHVGTRSIKQVQTHAQKYQQKLMRQQRGLRKRKTKLKRPEHRVDEVTLDQFTHKSIVRYAQRLVKEQDSEDDDEEDDAQHGQPEPTPAPPASLVDLSLMGVTMADWLTLSKETAEAKLLDLIPEVEPADECLDFFKFEGEPKRWSEWQLDELLQPTGATRTFTAHQGSNASGTEVVLRKCLV